MKRILIAGIAAISVAACANERVAEQQARIDRGVGGFEGAVAPISRPVTISIGPVRNFRGRMFNYAVTPDNQVKRFSGEVEGRWLAAQDKILMSWGIRRGQQNDWAFDLEVPLMKFEQWVERDGTIVGDMGIRFPAVEAGIVSFGAADTDKLREKLRETFAFNRTFAVTYGTYSEGSEVITTELSRRYLRHRFPKIPFRENTLSAQVVGMAAWKGRPCLLAKYTGAARAYGSKGQLILSWRGHWLVDAGTGLSLSNLIRIKLDASSDELNRNIVDMIGGLEVTDANFLQPPTSPVR